MCVWASVCFCVGVWFLLNFYLKLSTVCSDLDALASARRSSVTYHHTSLCHLFTVSWNKRLLLFFFFSGKKKSKFQTFKKLFARKKRKEPQSAGAEEGLKGSQSSDNVSKTSENNTLTPSEKEKGSGYDHTHLNTDTVLLTYF